MLGKGVYFNDELRLPLLAPFNKMRETPFVSLPTVDVTGAFVL